MMAHYDNYDYPAYWKNRNYEHDSEVIAIRSLLEKTGIKKFDSIIEVGCGFGRLATCYARYAKNVTLADPSGDLIKKAKKTYKSKKSFLYHVSSVEDIPKKVNEKQFDVCLMVRVLHHVEDLDKAFNSINKITKKNGYFILEFANKMHGKDQIKHFLRGNLTFPLDIFPVDKRSEKNKKMNSISFLNHHPDIVIQHLEENGFNVIATKSVSNFRSSFLKKYLPKNGLMWLEKNTQDILAKAHFGPSIFVLCKKIK